MKLEITHVPFGHVHEVYPLIVPYIIKGADWTMDRMNADEISASLFNPAVQLWIVFDPDTKDVHGYLSSEIRQYSSGHQFCVLNCGGRDGSLEACVDMVFDTFEQYAAQCGCTGIEIQGRAAWTKFVKHRGYCTPARVFYKKLGGAQT